MKQVPAFSLKDVEVVEFPSREELRRTYTLTSPGIECEILEVFPSRRMFVNGDKWLATQQRMNFEDGSSGSGSD